METAEIIVVGAVAFALALLGGWLWRRLTVGPLSEEERARAADQPIRRLLDVNIDRARKATGGRHAEGVMVAQFALRCEEIGETASAIKYHRQAEAILGEIGSADVEIARGNLERLRGQLGDDEFDRIAGEIEREEKEEKE